MDITKFTSIINEIKKSKGLNLIENINIRHNLRSDLDLDSFDLAELTVIIEDEYGVDIFENGIVNTVEEVINRLNN